MRSIREICSASELFQFRNSSQEFCQRIGRIKDIHHDMIFGRHLKER